MRLLNLFTGLFLCGSGVSGLFQDSREKELIELNTQKDKRIERLVIDSVRHAKPVFVHDTVVNVHDSLIIQKKTITMPLTGQESLGIGRIEFPIVQKEILDSYKVQLQKNHFQIKAIKGVKNDK